MTGIEATDSAVMVDHNELRLAAAEVGRTAMGMAMDLLAAVWHPDLKPFAFEPESLARRLNEVFLGRGYTPADLTEQKTALRRFFNETADGQFEPNPRMFRAGEAADGL